jgi:protein-tyrosine phosphatase
VEQDWALLDDLGVRLVCDLRSPKEIEKRPNRLPGEMLSLNIPVYLDNPIRLRTILFSRHRLDQKFQGFYRHTIIDHGAAALGKLLRLAAEPANLPILFHCTAGKDRTGIAAALFLHICQVPRSIILADYSLTNLSIEDFLDYYRRKAMSKRKIPGLKLEQLYPLFSARPQLLEQALTYIEDVYGSVDAYLMGPAGLTVRECMAIRENLTAT